MHGFLSPLIMCLIFLVLQNSAVKPSYFSTKTRGLFLNSKEMKFNLWSKENIHFFPELLPTETITWSKTCVAFFIISQWPNVKGSNDPGKIALFIIQS